MLNAEVALKIYLNEFGGNTFSNFVIQVLFKFYLNDCVYGQVLWRKKVCNFQNWENINLKYLLFLFVLVVKNTTSIN